MEVISQEKVKIRKSHNCWGCTNVFEPPAEMERVTSVDGGSIGSVYWCDTCQRILDDMDIYDKQDGFAYGELKEN